MSDAAPNPFDAKCLEVLKVLGKTLSQMNLYTEGHPAVKAMIGQAAELLGGLLAESGEVSYSLDGGKLIANGRVIGQVAQVPGSVRQLFDRFRLHSVTFRAGASERDLAALCRLAALRPEAAKGVAAGDFLAQQGAQHVALNEAVYAKVDKSAETPPAAEIGAPRPAPAEGGVPAGEIVRLVEEQPLERTLASLVRYAVPDPADQKAVIESVLKKVEADLQKRVAEATQELQRQKTRIQNEQTRTQAVLGDMADGVVVVDGQGKVLMMNPEAEDLFGSRMAELVGKELPALVKDEHLLAISKDMRIPEDRPISGEVQAVSTPDAGRTLRASTVVVRDEKGAPVGMVSALSDKAKHREMDKMEREFVAHVTHELRAPLSSIRAAIEILNDGLSGKLADDDARMLSSALRNTDRLEDLVNSILDFSKIESGQMTVHPKPADAERLARDAVESLRPWAEKKGLRLTLEVQPGLPVVDADMGRTVQVLVNLLSNAIKFSPKGGQILTRVRAADKGMVLYSVKDQGPGIPKEEHGRVFEKFVQIAAGEKHVGGTGLGLAIAKALVHMQKGQMWLESEKGKGAEFLFTLPKHVPPAGERAPASTAAKPRPWWKRLLGLK